MNKSSITKILAIIINIYLFVSAITICLYAAIIGFHFGQNFYPGPNPSFFYFFTNLSNIYGGVIALIVAIYTMMHFRDGHIIIPKWLKILALTASTSVGLTFITVLVFLAPTHALGAGSFFDMFTYEMFFFHFLNPVIIILMYIFAYRGKLLNYKLVMFSVIPMVIYGALYSILVLTNVWQDFYGFTFGGKYYLIPVVIIIMLLATYFIGFGINLLHNLRNKNR